MPSRVSLPRVSLSRRMKTFLAKWGGIVLAAILVVLAAVFGGMYLYASSRIDSTLAWVTQDVSLVPPGLTPSSVVENPPGGVYLMALRVDNPSSDPATVELSGISISLDEFLFEVVPIDLWQETVNPSGYILFSGNITIGLDTIKALSERGTVGVEINGAVSAQARYKWVGKDLERPVKITTTAPWPKLS